MGKETERKFLVNDFTFKAEATAKQEIRQGYLSTEKTHVVRLRIKDGKGFITIKGEGTGITRSEFEYEIPRADAMEMMQRMCSVLIEKFRYIVSYGGMKWEVDEFLNDNEGLLLAEIELEGEDQPFEKPPWISHEVTGDKRYYNAHLLNKPYKQW